jgi:hypothetical protein
MTDTKGLEVLLQDLEISVGSECRDIGMKGP